MIQLIEVCELSTANKNSQQRFTLREVYINPKHVISLREDARFQQKLNEGLLPPDLDERQKFTRVTIDKGNAGQEIVVVGPPSTIEAKIKGGPSELLLG